MRRMEFADQLHCPLPIISISTEVVPNLQLSQHKLSYIDPSTKPWGFIYICVNTHRASVPGKWSKWSLNLLQLSPAEHCELPSASQIPVAMALLARSAGPEAGFTWALGWAECPEFWRLEASAWVRLNSPPSIIGSFLLHRWSHFFFSDKLPHPCRLAFHTLWHINCGRKCQMEREIFPS